MHSKVLVRSLQRILERMPSKDSLVAVRLMLCGVYAIELQELRFEDFDGRILTIRGKRERKVIVDPTTSQLIKWLKKEKRSQKDKIIHLTRTKIAEYLSKVLKDCNIHLPYAKTSSGLKEAFITLSIEKGRNAASVYAQAGRKLPVSVKPPSIEDRLKDFDSKAIL